MRAEVCIGALLCLSLVLDTTKPCPRSAVLRPLAASSAASTLASLPSVCGGSLHAALRKHQAKSPKVDAELGRVAGARASESRPSGTASTSLPSGTASTVCNRDSEPVASHLWHEQADCAQQKKFQRKLETPRGNENQDGLCSHPSRYPHAKVATSGVRVRISESVHGPRGHFAMAAISSWARPACLPVRPLL